MHFKNLYSEYAQKIIYEVESYLDKYQKKKSSKEPVESDKALLDNMIIGLKQILEYKEIKATPVCLHFLGKYLIDFVRYDNSLSCNEFELKKPILTYEYQKNLTTKTIHYDTRQLYESSCQIIKGLELRITDKKLKNEDMSQEDKALESHILQNKFFKSLLDLNNDYKKAFKKAIGVEELDISGNNSDKSTEENSTTLPEQDGVPKGQEHKGIEENSQKDSIDPKHKTEVLDAIKEVAENILETNDSLENEYHYDIIDQDNIYVKLIDAISKSFYKDADNNTEIISLLSQLDGKEQKKLCKQFDFKSPETEEISLGALGHKICQTIKTQKKDSKTKDKMKISWSIDGKKYVYEENIAHKNLDSIYVTKITNSYNEKLYAVINYDKISTNNTRKFDSALDHYAKTFLVTSIELCFFEYSYILEKEQ